MPTDGIKRLSTQRRRIKRLKKNHTDPDGAKSQRGREVALLSRLRHYCKERRNGGIRRRGMSGRMLEKLWRLRRTSTSTRLQDELLPLYKYGKIPTRKVRSGEKDFD
jgi:hypothetical protein